MKGMFTQGFVVLMERPVALDELRPLLPDHPFLKVVPADGEWPISGDSAVVAFQPEVNGMVAIDTIPHAWPDHMGDPKAEPMIFCAWGMGHFGPFAFPGGLERAMQHAWTWREAKDYVSRHTAFVRLRLSYGFGAGPDDKVMPPDCDPRAELDFLTELVRGILRHPATIAYFNPNGEVVAPPAGFEQSLAYHRQHKLPPLGLWTNVRLFDLPGEWLIMDTVGNSQFDLPDLEVAFPKGDFAPPDVDYFLRNATLYLLLNGQVIQSGHTMNGPKNRSLRATRFKNGLSSPPREVLSWLPADAKNVPSQLTERELADATGSAANASASGKRPWWKRLMGK